MEKLIKEHFSGLNLDIRAKHPGYSRYMDQKVTPDVLEFISDCIWNLPNEEKSDFTVKTIWNSGYFEENAVAIFGKPRPSDFTSSNEYNKFIGQPLKTLAYAKVLNEVKRGRCNHYSIRNFALLEFISSRERNSYKFLYAYIVKVLADSGFINQLTNYENKVTGSSNPNPTDYNEFKSKFIRFMRGNTNINGEIEIRRILPKVLNPYAVYHGIHGSERGYMSKYPFTFGDLKYNRTNFRDQNKAKSESRQTARSQYEETVGIPTRREYEIKKATDKIRSKYSDSEIKDQWSRGKAVEVHHIFPQWQFPKFAASPENLILLTAEQHKIAHNYGHTKSVDRDYQIQCLISKCDSIEKSEINCESFYSQEDFIEMINECLSFVIDTSSCIADVKLFLSRL